MAERAFALADVERLSAILDGVSPDDRDRATLHAVFALAGQAAADQAEEGEVSGFAFGFYVPIKGEKQGQVSPGISTSESTPGIGDASLYNTFSISLLHGPSGSP